MTTRLLLVRHGAVSYSGRVAGAEDGLNTLGELQAQALARRLVERNVAAIYTSPLARARQTAEVLGQLLGAPVREDARLQERDPAGERTEALRDRVLAAVDEIVFSHPGQEVVVVSDGGALSALVGHCLGLGAREPEGWPFALDHCAISVLEFDGESAVVSTLNDGAHLEGLAL
jgi:broad specificity phosphatase PhoE